MRRAYYIDCREQGRGPADTVRFCSLATAAAYIRDRWQGADYCDGFDGFHTDYCSYHLRGFTLYEIGRFWFTDDGCREFTFRSDEQGPPIELLDDEPAEHEYGEPRPTATYTPEPLPVVPYDPAVIPF